MIQALLEADARLFLWINGLSGSWMDYFFGWTTFLATPALFLIVFILMLVWDDERKPARFFAVLGTSLGGILLSLGGKLLVDRARPYDFFYDEIARGEVVMNNLFSTVVSNSFPSSHAALAFALATALVGVYGRRLWPVFILASALSFTRVYVGAHFPSDVLAGAVLGIAGTLAAMRFVKKVA
ncbi:MAG: phosphatase PAP2 family protein [Candidatus Omnitrophota bacterium]